MQQEGGFCLKCLPERRGMTLQSRQGQGFLTLWWPRIDMPGTPHHWTSQGSSTCGKVKSDDKENAASDEDTWISIWRRYWRDNTEEKAILPYSEKHIFWSRFVELEDVIWWKPQAISLSEETEKAVVQRWYTWDRQSKKPDYIQCISINAVNKHCTACMCKLCEFRALRSTCCIRLCLRAHIGKLSVSSTNTGKQKVNKDYLKCQPCLVYHQTHNVRFQQHAG